MSISKLLRPTVVLLAGISLLAGTANAAHAADDPPPGENEPPEYTFPGVEPDECGPSVTMPVANPAKCMYSYRSDEIDVEISDHNISEGETFTVSVKEKKAGGWAPMSYGWELHLFHMGWGTSSAWVNEHELPLGHPGGFPNRPSSLFHTGVKLTKLSSCGSTDTECTWRLDKTWATSQKSLALNWMYVSVAIDGAANSGSHPYWHQTYLGIMPKYSEEPEAKISWRPKPGGDGWTIELDGSGSSDDGEIKQYTWIYGWEFLSDQKKYEYTYDPPCRHYTIENDGEPPCETSDATFTLGITDDVGLNGEVDETITFPVTPQQCNPQPCAIVVNDNGDGGDHKTGDDECDVNKDLTGSQCTLRAAIQEANSDATRDTIVFALPNGNTIAPPLELPSITQPLSIEGAGVRLSGPGGISNGLTVSAPDVAITGLQVGGFSTGIALQSGNGTRVADNYIGVTASGSSIPNGTGILANSGNNEITGNVVSFNTYDGMRLAGVGGNVVTGNLVGITPDGARPAGNGRHGISLASPGNRIGEPGRGNVIVANREDGINLYGGAGGTVIRANWIGVDPAERIVTGVLQGSNGNDGIHIRSTNPNVTVGGPGAPDGNVIAQNGSWAITAWSGGLRVENNSIGITPTSADPHRFPNIGGGVLVASSPNAVVTGNEFGYQVYGPSVGLLDATNATIQRNRFLAGVQAVQAAGTSTALIGGAGQANTFAGSRVVVSDTAKVRIRANEHLFHPIDPTGPAIDLVQSGTGQAVVNPDGTVTLPLGSGGVTPNDVGDADLGPNGFQNFPVLQQAATGGANVVVTGTLDSALYARSIDFYATSTCHSTGNGPGERYLGSVAVPPSQSAFSRSVPWTPGDTSQITATATGPDGTSEFSQCIALNDGKNAARFSTSAQRTGSKLVSGGTIKGKVAVYADTTKVQIPPGATVRFFIDGKSMGADDTAPYDMKGTATSGSAVLYDTKALTVGTHQMFVRITPTSGPTITLSPVAFTVTR